MVIKNLSIKNFQKHKSKELEFKPGLNVIYGKGSRGKSGIIKSIKWLYLNKPSGLKFKTQNIRGAVEVSDENLTHKKSSASHFYILKGEKYKALGLTTPQEVRDYSGITELNFIDQFKQYYFINLSSIDRIKLLNKLLGLEDINDILVTAASEIRETSAEIKVVKSQLKKAKESFNKLSWVPEAYKRFKIIKNLQDDRDSIAEELELFKKIQRLKDSEIKVPDLSKIKKYLKEYADLEKELTLLSEYLKLKQATEYKSKEIKVAEYKLKQYFKEIKVCPYCKNKIEED